MTGNLDPLQWLRLGVSLQSKDDDDDLDEADRPAGATSHAPPVGRKRRSRDSQPQKQARRQSRRKKPPASW
jgi:hypothetical protein